MLQIKGKRASLILSSPKKTQSSAPTWSKILTPLVNRLLPSWCKVCGIQRTKSYAKCLVALKCEWFKKQQEQQGDHGDTTALVVKQRLGLGFTRKEHPEQGGFGMNWANKSVFHNFGELIGFSSTQHSSLGAAVPKQTISKTIERAKTMINSGAGIPGANKVDMMRSAFKVG